MTPTRTLSPEIRLLNAKAIVFLNLSRAGTSLFGMGQPTARVYLLIITAGLLELISVRSLPTGSKLPTDKSFSPHRRRLTDRATTKIGDRSAKN
jgi:hypothetical protein